MDKLKQIESFVAVALKGSLTAAALAEGVAPAIIGRRLDALEARLGVKLLLRTMKAAPSWRTASACWPTLPTPRPASRPVASRPAAICASPRRPVLAGAM
jgi:hypothetical protein